MSTPTLKPGPVNPAQAVLAARVAQQQQRTSGATATTGASVATTSATATLQQPQPQPQPQILAVGQPSAQECFQHLQRSATNCRNAMMEIAYYGYRLRQANSWLELGFADEQTCHEYLGIPEATWNRYLVLGERLAHLALADLRSLSLASAQWLARVNPKIWDEHNWVAEARLLSSPDFAALVTQRNADRRLLAATSAVAPDAGSVEFKFKIAPARMRPFKQRLERIRQGYDVRSTAEALERALAAAEKELAAHALPAQEISSNAASSRD